MVYPSIGICGPATCRHACSGESRGGGGLVRGFKPPRRFFACWSVYENFRGPGPYPPPHPPRRIPRRSVPGMVSPALENWYALAYIGFQSDLIKTRSLYAIFLHAYTHEVNMCLSMHGGITKYNIHSFNRKTIK